MIPDGAAIRDFVCNVHLTSTLNSSFWSIVDKLCQLTFGLVAGFRLQDSNRPFLSQYFSFLGGGWGGYTLVTILIIVR